MNQEEIEKEIESRIKLLEKHIILINSHPMPNYNRIWAHKLEIKNLENGLVAMRTV